MLSSHRNDATIEVVFRRPGRLNAFDQAQLRALLEAIRAFEHDVAARVLVIRGEGRAFSAGSDVHELCTLDAEGFAEATALYQELARSFARLRKPTIAAIGGHALGGGLEVALMCDIRVASLDARLGCLTQRWGSVPAEALATICLAWWAWDGPNTSC